MMMYMSVLSGSEETKISVCTRGSWTLHRRGLHRSSDLSLLDGLTLGVGIHPWVNTALRTLPPLSIFCLITSLVLPLLCV